MVEGFIYPLLVLAISGLGFFCYNNPTKGSKMCIRLSLFLLFLLVLIGFFQFGYKRGAEEFVKYEGIGKDQLPHFESIRHTVIPKLQITIVIIGLTFVV